MTDGRRSVAVIGGGVAGIAAATALADAGYRVELIEKRPLLGGRASSFADPRTGERVDECQHGTMRCCTNLTDLLNRLGVGEKIEYHSALPFLDREGRRSVIEGCGLPAPAHTALSFLRFRSINLRDKLGIARGMWAMLRSRPGDPAAERTTIAEWFQQTGQTDQAVRHFWSPILVSACNETNDRISCASAFKLFRDGFLLNEEAFHFGTPTVPLATLYTEPTIAYLDARGGRVRTRTRVQEFRFEDQQRSDRLTGVTLTGGERLEADWYVSALQFDLLLKLLPPEHVEKTGYWEVLRGIELSPITGVHLWFDRPLAAAPALALLDRQTEWIFNKNRLLQRPAGEPAYLTAVISASRRLAQRSNEELIAATMADVRECVPGAHEAELVHARVIQWPKATLSPLPGVEARRPGPVSPIANLFVAGEWTDTGWPSTMEGAARSGYRAAEALLAADGAPRSLLQPGLPISRLARLLSR